MNVIVVVIILVLPLVPRIWWSKDCDVCDHTWRRVSRFMDPSPRYRCRSCDRALQRIDDEWPPGCGVGGAERDCGWPHCQPIGTASSLPRRYLDSIRRLMWRVWDAPE